MSTRVRRHARHIVWCWPALMWAMVCVAGCATHTITTPVDGASRTYVISYRGRLFDSDQTRARQLLYRCAELAVDAGYSAFSIVSEIPASDPVVLFAQPRLQIATPAVQARVVFHDAGQYAGLLDRSRTVDAHAILEHRRMMAQHRRTDTVGQRP